VSTLDTNLDAVVRPVRTDGLELTGARTATVGDLTVRRLLPLRQRRSVGAWCFIDHYGPMSVDGVTGMAVPPHPHIGLQTVTWLMAGNVLHSDSLGSEQMIRPGQLNLMTAGRGIAHAECSPAEHDPQLHGVQLWVALPDRSRQAEPAFEHHSEMPSAAAGGLSVTVLLGSLAGLRSPATTFTDIVGAELTAMRDASERIALAPSFEHAVLVTSGGATVAGADLAPGRLLYLAPGRDHLAVAAREGLPKRSRLPSRTGARAGWARSEGMRARRSSHRRWTSRGSFADPSCCRDSPPQDRWRRRASHMCAAR
jgi:redox-sensitive bicupin YhaK (pirin superfamily)